MLIPYLAWVTFAAFLNFTLWRMNSKPVYPVAFADLVDVSREHQTLNPWKN